MLDSSTQKLSIVRKLEKMKTVRPKVDLYKSKNSMKDSSIAYDEFIKNWDIDYLTSIKEYRAFGLNDLGYVICKMSILIVDKKEKLFSLLGEAKRQNLPKIIVAENRVIGDVGPSSKETQLAIDFKKEANRFGITVLDQLILTSNSYYSFDDNKYKTHKAHYSPL